MNLSDLHVVVHHAKSTLGVLRFSKHATCTAVSKRLFHLLFLPLSLLMRFPIKIRNSELEPIGTQYYLSLCAIMIHRFQMQVTALIIAQKVPKVILTRP